MRSNKTCIVDSSAFLALNHPKDHNYNKEMDIAKQLDGYSFLVTDAIINETQSLLRYRLGFQTAQRFLSMVVYHDQYEIIDVTLAVREEACSLLEKYADHKISYCDALTVAAYSKYRVDWIFAFDHHLEMMGARVKYI